VVSPCPKPGEQAGEDLLYPRVQRLVTAGQTSAAAPVLVACSKPLRALVRHSTESLSRCFGVGGGVRDQEAEEMLTNAGLIVVFTLPIPPGLPALTCGRRLLVKLPCALALLSSQARSDPC
jgi:hypothetical protein